MTPDTSVHVAAPERLDCRLYPAAAPCVLSAVGAVQVTVSAPPGACASDGVPGVFGVWGVGVTGAGMPGAP